MAAFNHHFLHATSLLVLVLVAVTASAAGAGGYGNTNPDQYEKPKPEKQNNLLSTNAILGIQGLVYCKSGHKVVPLEGEFGSLSVN